MIELTGYFKHAAGNDLWAEILVSESLFIPIIYGSMWKFEARLTTQLSYI